MTIEDAAELQLQQRHVVSLEARPPNIEGQGEVRIRELVRNALRMRPDRIIVGEVRGAETLDMLQAMNTGHEGSLTTIHANTPRDALHRLEMLVLMAGVDLPLRAIREQIASAFDLIIHLTRLVDGTRRVSRITEVAGMEGDVVTMQDLFVARSAEEERRDGGKVCAPRAAPLDRPAAELPAEARRRTASICRRRRSTRRLRERRRGCSLVAAALALLSAPAAGASPAFKLRQVDVGVVSDDPARRAFGESRVEPRASSRTERE